MPNLTNAGDSATVAPAAKRPATKETRPAIKTERGPTLSDWLVSCAAAQPFRPLERLVAGKTPPLLWGWTAEDSAALHDMHGLIDRAIRTQKWKANQAGMLAATDQPESAAALQGLAFAYIVPLFASYDRSGGAETMLMLLFSRLEAPTDSAAAPQSSLAKLYFEVELPLILAHYAPDARTANSLRKGVLAAEAKLAISELDTQGLPKDDKIALLRPWLASLVRSHELIRNSEMQFSDAARERLSRLTRNVLRLSRADGGSVLTTTASSASDREFLTAALMASESARPLAALALGKPNKPAPEVKLPKGTPAAPMYSAASSFAILRTRWAAPATQLTVDYSGPQVWLDLTSGNQSLLHGSWQVDLQVDGRPAEPLGTWSEVCWHSDADCDYLEIEQKLSGGYLLQRHLLLVRRDQSLLLADSVLDETKQTPAEFLAKTNPFPRLEYACRLPLSPGIGFLPQGETREGQLVLGRQRFAHVLPIALPEWRKQPAAGELVVDSHNLKHTLRANGRNLFAPLWIDLHPARQKSPLTWRQLTIGESLVVQPREVAVGYRVQVHAMQWLLYRSLAWRGNRTLLGKNFATDFACCRFLPNGETEEILEVQ